MVSHAAPPPESFFMASAAAITLALLAICVALEHGPVHQLCGALKAGAGEASMGLATEGTSIFEIGRTPFRDT